MPHALKSKLTLFAIAAFIAGCGSSDNNDFLAHLRVLNTYVPATGASPAVTVTASGATIISHPGDQFISPPKSDMRLHYEWRSAFHSLERGIQRDSVWVRYNDERVCYRCSEPDLKSRHRRFDGSGNRPRALSS